MKSINSTNFYYVTLASIALTLGVGIGSLQAQTFSYSDTATANAATGANYYTAADGNAASGGTTGAYTVSEPNPGLSGNGASLDVASGSLTILATQYGIDMSESGSTSVNVSGGTLTLSTIGFSNPFQTALVNFGGDDSLTDAFTFTQQGGTTIIDSTGGFDLGFRVSVNATLTGGVFEDIDTTGTTFGLQSGSGTITLGAGNGVFEQTGTNALTFNSGDINFLAGSGGSVSLLGETLAQYKTLISNGDILINGNAATASQFSYASTNGQGILELAPEPSTWALLLSGCAVLLGIQRRRFLQS